jgi:competence protein ComEC
MTVDVAAWAVERHAAGTLRVTCRLGRPGRLRGDRVPGSHVWVVDGGGAAGSRFDVGERVVAPALWRRKILQVDGAGAVARRLRSLRRPTFLADAFAPRRFGGMAAPAPARTSRRCSAR